MSPPLVRDVVLVVLDHVVGPAPERSSKESEASPPHLLAPGTAQGQWVTCLLLRKQLWMTFMIKLAASRSVMLGLNLCLGRDERRPGLCDSDHLRNLLCGLVWSLTLSSNYKATWGAEGHLAIPEALSALGTQAYIKRFLGRSPADGQLFPKWHLLQKLDCLAPETWQACVQHECNQRDNCIHVGPVETQRVRDKVNLRGTLFTVQLPLSHTICLPASARLILFCTAEWSCPVPTMPGFQWCVLGVSTVASM